jgi:hypothetical protein
VMNGPGMNAGLFFMSAASWRHGREVCLRYAMHCGIHLS